MAESENQEQILLMHNPTHFELEIVIPNPSNQEFSRKLIKRLLDGDITIVLKNPDLRSFEEAGPFDFSLKFREVKSIEFLGSS